MGISLRSMMMAGVSTVAVGAIVIAPSVAPPPLPTVQVAFPVDLAADVAPFTAEALQSTLEILDKVVPSSDLPAAATAVADDAPIALNTASNVIDAVYAVSRYWANYAALELGPWLLGWVPLGYLISDQIYIWYPTVVLPVVDSFVYQFLDPIVNDPLNPAVWGAGLTAMFNTAVSGIGSAINQEIQYILSLQWLPFPIPPLPGALSTVQASATAETDTALLDAKTVDPAAPVTDTAVATTEDDTATDAPVEESVVTPVSAVESTPADVEPADLEQADLEQTEVVTEPASAAEPDEAETEPADAEPVDETAETDESDAADASDAPDTDKPEASDKAETTETSAGSDQDSSDSTKTATESTKTTTGKTTAATDD
ncbi:MAG: hypothetical protein HYZ38_25075 [Mycobacterium sp.]|nr:hypothetical protein [Mycobacterium sp.]